MEIYSSSSPNYVEEVKLKLKNFVKYKGYKFNITEDNLIVEYNGMCWGNLLGHKVSNAESMTLYLTEFEKFLGEDKFFDILKEYKPLQQRKVEWEQRALIFKELKSISSLCNLIKEDYISVMLGSPYKIDIVYLDKKLMVPEGVSTNQFISDNFGVEVSNKVKKLL